MVAILIPSLILPVTWLVWAVESQRESNERTQFDRQIEGDLQQALEAHFRNLGPNDGITRMFGAFRQVTDGHIVRSPPLFQVQERRGSFTAIAHFEKAQSRVNLGLDRGAAVRIVILKMEPDEKEVSTKLKHGWNLRVIGNEMVLERQIESEEPKATDKSGMRFETAKPTGSPISMSGRAEHPAFRQ
jgi:hypothetical protein